MTLSLRRVVVATLLGFNLFRFFLKFVKKARDSCSAVRPTVLSAHSLFDSFALIPKVSASGRRLFTYSAV